MKFNLKTPEQDYINLTAKGVMPAKAMQITLKKDFYRKEKKLEFKGLRARTKNKGLKL